jgi:malate dehydrogenase (oxaloacetate-decarboxylating)(NADP+)
VDIIAALHPTFGGINLEDIKAPECFYIERKLRERLSIPVFHDDQHGTAIVVGAGMLNALDRPRYRHRENRLLRRRCCGHGLPGTAGGPGRTTPEHLRLRQQGRADHRARTRWRKAAWAQDTSATTLSEVMEGADVFLGVSGPGVLSPLDISA